jgi:hypothetical protein
VTPPTFAEARAGVWALRALWRARWALRRDPLALPPLPAPFPAPATAGRGVVVALGCARATCLERAAVRQVWLAAHGERRDLVIGVTGPASFAAHAWLDGESASDSANFVELVRLASP